MSVSLEQARLVGEHDSLHAVAEAELLEDVRDVCLDGRLADVQLSADLPVREAARAGREDVADPAGVGRAVIDGRRGAELLLLLLPLL